MKYNKEFTGKKIREERKKLHMTQQELGDRINPPKTGKQISNYEKGALQPPMKTLYSLCEVFHCELGYLLGEDAYRDGTQTLTTAHLVTGLSIEALNAIQAITGKDDTISKFAMPDEAESRHTQKVLSNLIASKKFPQFLECLKALDTYVNETARVFSDIEEKFGTQVYQQAKSIYESEYDYEYFDSDITPAVEEAIREYESAIDKKYTLEQEKKKVQYELFEAYILLINDLYPNEIPGGR